MAKRKVYYAHSLYLYGTSQEARDIELLEQLGFRVVNPNSEEFAYMEGWNSKDRMTRFFEIAAGCDLIAFRALPDGKITAGVAKEIKAGPPVIELPSGMNRRGLTIQQTVETLQELGER